MDALGFDLTGDIDGFVVTFHGEDIGRFPTWARAVEFLKSQRQLVRLAAAMLDQSLETV